MEQFNKLVSRKLSYYVYLLIDPRDNKVFYIGKGKGNRVFDHLKGVINADNDGNMLDTKADLITEIRQAGKEVIHVIARWGLTKEKALEYESLLIDFIKSPLLTIDNKLTNKINGHGSYKFQTIEQINRILSSGDIDLNKIRHNILTITINESLEGQMLYERVRGNWNISLERAKKADYVFALFDGIVIGIFKPYKDGWKIMPPDEDKKDKKRNWVSFTGVEEQDKEITKLYLHKKMPKKKKGNSNPINYLY